MKERLGTWGYDVAVTACYEWLRRYRLGDGAKDGSAAIYTLSRQDLQRWYHVEGLRSHALVDRYRAETGIYAHQAHLSVWLKAPSQALEEFDNNEDIHAHACGEYVLQQLQEGKKPDAVVQLLLSQYLVRATSSRVQAYRTYREKRGDYWTAEKLEQSHWEFLYTQVALDKNFVRPGKKALEGRLLEQVLSVRTALARQVAVPEELLPPHNICHFYREHQEHARLSLRYPHATVVRDSVPWRVVQAYQRTFRGQVLEGNMQEALNKTEQGVYQRAVMVANEDRLIVFPKASADACLIAAYSMLQCREIFAAQTWTWSISHFIFQVFIFMFHI